MEWGKVKPLRDVAEELAREIRRSYSAVAFVERIEEEKDGRKKAYLPVRPVVGDTWSLYNDLHEFVYGGKDEGRLEGYITRMIPQKDSIVIEISTK